jgi:diguanylate cyclase (GGDEF)-like protein
MPASRAAVLDAAPADRKSLIQALRKAGLTLTSTASPDALSKEAIVVLGPKARPATARAVRRRLPEALLLAAQRALKKPSWADALLPWPVSPADLKVRLPELWRLREGGSGPSRSGEAVVDALTGFYTFTHFKEILFVEVKRARRYGFPLAAALVAVDPLGVPLGGELMAQLMGGLALAIRRSLRDTDYPVQYSTDHVLVLMPHTDLAGAVIVSRRICDRVAHATLTEGERLLRPTVSIGVAAAVGKGGAFSFADLARNAQSSLEEASEKGGNRVEFFDAAAQAQAVTAAGGD